MPCGYAFATHSDDHGHFQPAGQAGSGTSAACQRHETDAAITHHTGSQSADISPRCSAASPGREVGWTWRQVQRRTSPGGAGARHMGDVPLRRIAGAAQDSVPAIVFYRQSGLVEYPRDRSICWSAQLVRLEPAGHIPIYERGHAVSARIALFPDELQQSVGMEERCRIRSVRGAGDATPTVCDAIFGCAVSLRQSTPAAADVRNVGRPTHVNAPGWLHKPSVQKAGGRSAGSTPRARPLRGPAAGGARARSSAEHLTQPSPECRLQP